MLGTLPACNIANQILNVFESSAKPVDHTDLSDYGHIRWDDMQSSLSAIRTGEYCTKEQRDSSNEHAWQ